MNNTVLERIGIDPIILFIIAFILIAVLFVMNRRNTIRYEQLKKAVKKMNKFLRTQGVPVQSNLIEEEEESRSGGKMSRKEQQAVRELRSSFADTYQKTGIVKYDAFDEMGGKLSFVLVMLDGRDNGILLNVMHSRDDCYTYIKEIKRGSSYVELSAEEQIALEKAMHQDRYFEDDRDGIPTGHTGNLKRAYTVAVRKEEAKKKARKMREKEAAEAQEIEAKAEEIMSKEDK